MLYFGKSIDLRWSGLILDIRKKKYAELVRHPKYEGMYYIRWNNGTMSNDFYNITRAKQHAIWFAVRDICHP